MIETYIAGLGLYRADEDLFDEQAARSKAELLAEVIDRCAEEVGDRTQYRKLRKRELAAMLADFATGARRNERQARERAELVAASKAKAEAAREERRLDRAGVIAAPHECDDWRDGDCSRCERAEDEERLFFEAIDELVDRLAGGPPVRGRFAFDLDFDELARRNGFEPSPRFEAELVKALRLRGWSEDADPVEADVEAPADEPGPFDVGARVEHDFYGPGTIAQAPHFSASLLVRFDGGAVVHVAPASLRSLYEPALLRGADFAELVEAVAR